MRVVSHYTEALQKPEIGKILKASTGALKKLIMVTLMQKTMIFFALISYWLDRLGIWKKKRAREKRFEEVDKIKRNILTLSRKYKDKEIYDEIAIKGGAGVGGLRRNAAAAAARGGGGGSGLDPAYAGKVVGSSRGYHPYPRTSWCW